MSAYDPPTQNLQIFDSDYFFPDEDNPITLGEAERIFVKKSLALITGSLSVAGTTTLNSTLSIPSYSDVGAELTAIDGSLNAIEGNIIVIDGSFNAIENHLTLIDSSLNTIDNHLTLIDGSLNTIEFKITGIDYDAINDTTTIDNTLQVNKILYANQYIYATQIYSSTEFGIETNGNIYLNMNDEGSVVVSGGNIYNVNGSAIIQDGASGTNQLRSTNYTGNINMGTNTITNVSFSSTTVNTYADMKYDITGKNIYYKEVAFGQFSSTQNQSISATTTPTLFTFNTTTNATNCSINTTTSQVKVLVQGLYRFSVSPNIEGNGSHIIKFWFVKNGTAVPNSASQITISAGKSLPFVELLEPMNVNDYIEVAAIADSSGQQITAVAAASPVPAIPSIILTVQRIG